jgi:hypothetical protein
MLLPEDRLASMLAVRFTEEERVEIRTEAARSGCKNESVWIRALVQRALKNTRKMRKT